MRIYSRLCAVMIVSIDSKLRQSETITFLINEWSKLTLYSLNSSFCRFHNNYSLYKVGSFRLPTHSRDAHRKFFYDPFYN